MNNRYYGFFVCVFNGNHTRTSAFLRLLRVAERKMCREECTQGLEA